MKLKAPQGVGDPCIAGVAITPRNGVYEVEVEIGALLIECFGFFAADREQAAKPEAAVAAVAPRNVRPRRGRTVKT